MVPNEADLEPDTQQFVGWTSLNRELRFSVPLDDFPHCKRSKQYLNSMSALG